MFRDAVFWKCEEDLLKIGVYEREDVFEFHNSHAYPMHGRQEMEKIKRKE